MAGRAAHLPGLQRMRVGLDAFGPYRLMTLVADLRLGCSAEYRIPTRVDGMAVSTGHLIAVVWTTVPAKA
jgi:hypothetical protein